MKKIDETTIFQEKLKHYEAQAPDFDALFQTEVLSDAALRPIFQSKLNHLESDSPSFDDMFAGETLVKTAPKKRMFPLWISIGAAAACLGLLLLLPKDIQLQPQQLTQTKQTAIQKVEAKSRLTTHRNRRITALAETVEKPEIVEPLTFSTHRRIVQDDTLNNTDKKVESDTSNSTTQIKPAKKSNLTVNNGRSVEKAYAEAKAKKGQAKHDKMTLGTNLISSNRLLSQVNTKSTDIYPLQGIAKSYSAAFNTLESDANKLTSSSGTTKNTWLTPENLPKGFNLQEYKAVYSMPLSLGLSVSIPVCKNIELISGLNYTYLSGNVSGSNASLTFDLKQELHYLGIPLKASVKFLNMGRFGVYAAFGGTLEKALAGVQNAHVDKTDGNSSDWEHSQAIDGFQTSITGQLGVSFELNKTFNLYFEPGVSYYNPSNQPISSRTEEPFNFNLGLGLRYHFN